VALISVSLAFSQTPAFTVSLFKTMDTVLCHIYCILASCKLQCFIVGTVWVGTPAQ